MQRQSRCREETAARRTLCRFDNLEAKDQQRRQLRRVRGASSIHPARKFSDSLPKTLTQIIAPLLPTRKCKGDCITNALDVLIVEYRKLLIATFLSYFDLHRQECSCHLFYVLVLVRSHRAHRPRSKLPSHHSWGSWGSLVHWIIRPKLFRGNCRSCCGIVMRRVASTHEMVVVPCSTHLPDIVARHQIPRVQVSRTACQYFDSAAVRPQL